MMMGCKKCTMITGALFLIAGILFLLVDVGVWSFGGLTWWTVLFLIVGVSALASSKCHDCMAMCGMGMSDKKMKK